MKGKNFTRLLLGVTSFALLVQNIFCRLYFETHTQFCCENNSNSSGFSCWNIKTKENSIQNAWPLANYSQNETFKVCFNVTEEGSCRDNSVLSVVEPGKKEIRIGAFVPFLLDDRYGHYTAMKMAIDMINNRSGILDNYTLVLVPEDTNVVSKWHSIYLNYFNIILIDWI